MNKSYPRANLHSLESRIKFFKNTESNNKNPDKKEKACLTNHIKKIFILNSKTKELIKRNSILKDYNKNFCKKNTNYDPKYQIRLIKSKYFHNELIRKNVYSPLKRRYKQLITNLPSNKRCFINLHNKDFDFIFRYPNNSTSSILYKTIIIKNNNNKNLIQKRTLNKSIKSKKDLADSIKTIHYKISSDSVIYNRDSFIVDKEDKKIKNIMNYIYKKKELSFGEINKAKQKVNLIEKNKKYLKLLLLIKRQSKKNLKLLNDVKKEEIKSKDSLLSCLARYNISSERIKRNTHN